MATPHNWLTKAIGGLGHGIVTDFNARRVHYKSDWTEIFNEDRRAITRILAAAVYIFFASAIPAIAFGEQLSHETHKEMGVLHTLLATGLTGCIQAIFGGQPLLIVGVAEPIVIVYHLMYQYTKKTDVNFVPWCAWACSWTAIFLLLLAITNTCQLIKRFTRFCGETFAMLIAILFLQEAIRGLVEEFRIDIQPSYLKTLNGIFGLLLAVVYIWISHTFSGARSWKLGLSLMRAVIADYGFAIAIFVLTGVSYALKVDSSVPQRLDVDQVSDSTWFKSGIYTVLQMKDVAPLQILAAIIPGFVISILFYFDHSVSSQLAQQKDFNVKKPSAYHYDLLLLAFMTILCGLLGLPPVNGVIPQAPLHTRALCSKKKQGVSENKEPFSQSAELENTTSKTSLFVVHENRISNLTQALLCIVLFVFGSTILSIIPTCLIAAFFAFMSLESLPGNQLWDRLQIIISDPKRRLKNIHAVYVETVEFSAIVIFTLVQVVLLLIIWAITVWSGLFGISFPVWIMALVPFRWYIFPLFIKKEYLDDLDSDEIEEFGPGKHIELPKINSRDMDEDESAQDMLDESMGHFPNMNLVFHHLHSENDSSPQRRHSIDVPSYDNWNPKMSDIEAKINRKL